jgi:toxin ParE1/3/4
MAHRLAPHAISDLDDIWFYIAKETGSTDTADHLVDAITNRFFLLARHPYLGRRRDEDFGSGSRSFSVKDYVIVYRVQGEDVLIVRVVHGRRNLEDLCGW